MAAAARHPRFIGARHVVRNEPPIAAGPRLPPIQTAVDENPREPDLEPPALPIRGNVRKDAEERVLNRLVGLGGIAKILIRNPRRAALMERDELRKTLASLVHPPVFDQRANLDGDPGVVREGSRRSASISSAARRRGRFEIGCRGVAARAAITHRRITMRADWCLQFTVIWRMLLDRRMLSSCRAATTRGDGAAGTGRTR